MNGLRPIAYWVFFLPWHFGFGNVYGSHARSVALSARIPSWATRSAPQIDPRAGHDQVLPVSGPVPTSAIGSRAAATYCELDPRKAVRT